ncbi:rRNA methyltransferase [Pontibacillus halophilus JSM 076056 = DSM 19796]|uniref:rRNA methyltransferase n=1 Tax=Pontibacillus halophilus JSM 076056 = DSM 19796 TaxID=1385510 RepID=A0A0A5G8Q4_9BACI|nr:class I SAM-dependent methyltransferase [Pontibacillus halophilus]KGX89501.1 rRNA methyltransferase [Pontibacillus halophilus JSM 076056 = DSM 19796]
MLQRILDYAHHLLSGSVEEGDWVVDGTAGNGYDTVFLSKLVGETGHVLSFDIQEQAIYNTDEKLAEHESTNVSLILDSHDRLDTYLPSEDTVLGGAIFNLGYLPGSDKQVITKSTSTIPAVQSILKHLKQRGILILVVYYGHEGGEEEKTELLKYVSKLDQKQYNVLRYGFINQKNNPPFIVAVEKK